MQNYTFRCCENYAPDVWVTFGGRYWEDWDEHYHLTVRYEGQTELLMRLENGEWHCREGLPEIPLAEIFFPAAAEARLLADEFLASGMMPVQNSRNYHGKMPVNAEICSAEFLRILMDEYGLRMETVWPTASSMLASQGKRSDALWEREAEDDAERFVAAMEELQPRTGALMTLQRELRKQVPDARHDIRLPQCRNRTGAVRAQEMLVLSILETNTVTKTAVLELCGDVLREEYPMEWTETGWVAALRAPETACALWYRFRLSDGEHTWWLCPGADGLRGCLFPEPEDGFRLTVFERSFETPAWFRGGILYQIFPDRFAFSDDGKAEEGIRYHAGLGQTPELHTSLDEEPRWQPRSFEQAYTPDDFYGGRLTAIREKLDYLKQLGVTCLYLNPIVEARSNHRYDTSDYLRVDPILGSNEDFDILCRVAEKCGIRILCDGVFSHTGADSVYFNRDGHYPQPGACQQTASPWDSWYRFEHFPDQYRSWWGFRELPEVEEHDPAWQDFVVTGKDSVVRQWLRRGAAGWRLDVADELPDDVLCLIRKAAKAEKRDALILGEVWEDAVLKESYGTRRTYALGGALDTVMNYPFRTEVLAYLRGTSPAGTLANFLMGQRMHYPTPMYFSLMNLLGSHDVERLQTALATDGSLKNHSREEQLQIEQELTEEQLQRARSLSMLGFAIQFSIPGVPSIYYGDEQGMRGTNDPFNRRPFREHGDEELFNIVKELSALHAKYRILREGDLFAIGNGEDVLLLLRYPSETMRGNSFTKDAAILTVINRASDPRPFRVLFDGWTAEGEAPASSALVAEIFKKNPCIPVPSVLFYHSL